jgi:hypothetical protein
MADTRYRPEHAQRVIEVAKSELEILMRQRSAISKRVKQVKRTVEGLTSLFGTESVSATHSECGEGPRPSLSDAICQTRPVIEIRFASEVPDQEFDDTALSEDEDFAQSDIPRNNTLRPKLERACRIALLESEEAATSAQIYDRIIRRGSYQLNRCKHPLVHIIKTLDALEQRGEVQTVVEGDCRRWLWNVARQGMNNSVMACEIEEQI